MNTEATHILEDELGPGESLLWAGQPRQGVFLTTQDIFLIPFSLLWGGFAFFWEGMVVSHGAPLIFELWGIPFVLVGSYLILGRFFVEARQRAAMYYGVTTERIVIVTRWPVRQTKTFSLRTLSEISQTQQSGGRGTLTFGPTLTNLLVNRRQSFPGSALRLLSSFEWIDDPQTVFEIIRTAQKQLV